MKVPPTGLLALAATLIMVAACHGHVGQPEVPVFAESERLDREVGQALERAVARAREERSAEEVDEIYQAMCAFGALAHATQILGKLTAAAQSEFDRAFRDCRPSPHVDLLHDLIDYMGPKSPLPPPESALPLAVADEGEPRTWQTTSRSDSPLSRG